MLDCSRAKRKGGKPPVNGLNWAERMGNSERKENSHRARHRDGSPGGLEALVSAARATALAPELGSQPGPSSNSTSGGRTH